MLHGDISNEAAPGIMVDASMLCNPPTGNGWKKILSKILPFLRSRKCLSLSREGREFLWTIRNNEKKYGYWNFYVMEDAPVPEEIRNNYPIREVVTWSGVEYLDRDMKVRSIKIYFSSLAAKQKFSRQGVHPFESWKKCHITIGELVI